MKPKTVKIFLVTVDIEEGGNAYMVPFSSRRKAVAGLAGFCRAQWQAQKHEDKLPRDNQAAIDRYFEFWTPEESYEINELVLDQED